MFTDEERVPDPRRTPMEPGCVHHVAFSLSQATFHQAVERLDERGIHTAASRIAVSWTRSTPPTRSGC